VAPVIWLGGLGILGGEALRASVLRRRSQPALLPDLVREVDALLVFGLPLVGLVHVGLGSLLTMQAYFGAVLPKSIGGVVGVGLFRNAATLMSGFTLAGLITLRIAVDLGQLRHGPAAQGQPGDARRGATQRNMHGQPQARDPGRVVFAKVAAAMAVGPVLALWGALIGLVIGALIAHAMLGVASGPYFGLFLELLRARDIVGMGIKGMLYPGLAAMIACNQILRTGNREAVSEAALRAIVYSFVAILVCNMTWFCLFYVSGPPLGLRVSAGM
jgi:phospholipid/cholesterol/gamma-HCH transport system permease protein